MAQLQLTIAGPVHCAWGEVGKNGAHDAQVGKNRAHDAQGEAGRNGPDNAQAVPSTPRAIIPPGLPPPAAVFGMHVPTGPTHPPPAFLISAQPARGEGQVEKSRQKTSLPFQEPEPAPCPPELMQRLYPELLTGGTGGYPSRPPSPHWFRPAIPPGFEKIPPPCEKIPGPMWPAKTEVESDLAKESDPENDPCEASDPENDPCEESDPENDPCEASDPENDPCEEEQPKPCATNDPDLPATQRLIARLVQIDEWNRSSENCEDESYESSSSEDDDWEPATAHGPEAITLDRSLMFPARVVHFKRPRTAEMKIAVLKAQKAHLEDTIVSSCAGLVDQAENALKRAEKCLQEWVPNSLAPNSLATVQSALRAIIEAREAERNNLRCGICLSRESDTVFLPCGHRLCHECSVELQKVKPCAADIADNEDGFLARDPGENDQMIRNIREICPFCKQEVENRVEYRDETTDDGPPRKRQRVFIDLTK